MAHGSVEEFQAQRPRLFGIAYRMLGSAADADDIVQDAWLRWQTADRPVIQDVAAFLARIVTNLCLNALDSARARREIYVGSWLPEPVLTADGTLGPLDTAEQRDLVSVAILTLLERLTPAERASYVLREAFGYTHREVAQLIDTTEANARQLFARARTKLGAGAARQPSTTRSNELISRFLLAARDGDLQSLEALLSDDVTAWSDGGGIVNAARRPVHGRERVARYVAGVIDKFARGYTASISEANGEPVVLARDSGALRAVWFIELSGGRITGLRAMLNPEKLVFAATQLSHNDELIGLSW